MSYYELEIVKVRQPGEVAERTLTLFSVWGLTTDTPRTEVDAWLAESGLCSALTPSERRFVEDESPHEQTIINYSWHAERLIVLLWALGRVVKLPPGDQKCDTDVFAEHLPPFSSITIDDFIDGAVLLPDSRLIEFADECVLLHGEARSATHNKRPPRGPVDIRIIQERHHAINWVIGYGHLPWDEVTTGT